MMKIVYLSDKHWQIAFIMFLFQLIFYSESYSQILTPENESIVGIKQYQINDTLRTFRVKKSLFRVEIYNLDNDSSVHDDFLIELDEIKKDSLIRHIWNDFIYIYPGQDISKTLVKFTFDSISHIFYIAQYHNNVLTIRKVDINETAKKRKIKLYAKNNSLYPDSYWKELDDYEKRTTIYSSDEMMDITYIDYHLILDSLTINIADNHLLVFGDNKKYYVNFSYSLKDEKWQVLDFGKYLDLDKTKKESILEWYRQHF